MSRRNVGLRVLGVMALACIGLTPLRGLAQEETPAVEAKCINDHGRLLGKKAKARIKALCKKARRDKIEMMVVTVKSVSNYHPRPMSLDSFVDDIFDDWDVEYVARANAILLFVAKKERQIRIKLGDDFSDKAWKKAQGIMKRTVGPSLGRRASSGINKGFSRLYKEVAKPRVKALKKEMQESRRRAGTVNFE